MSQPYPRTPDPDRPSWLPLDGRALTVDGHTGWMFTVSDEGIGASVWFAFGKPDCERLLLVAPPLENLVGPSVRRLYPEVDRDFVRAVGGSPVEVARAWIDAGNDAGSARRPSARK